MSQGALLAALSLVLATDAGGADRLPGRWRAPAGADLVLRPDGTGEWTDGALRWRARDGELVLTYGRVSRAWRFRWEGDQLVLERRGQALRLSPRPPAPTPGGTLTEDHGELQVGFDHAPEGGRPRAKPDAGR